MCLQCHSGLSDEFVLKDLKKALEQKNYDIFNKTSICHILYAAVNYNGEEVKEVGIQLLEEYNMWSKQNNELCFGFNLEGILEKIKELNYSPEEIKNDINHCGGKILGSVFENNYIELRKLEGINLNEDFEIVD